MSKPNLFKLNSWKSHETRVLEVFSRGLRRLEAEPNLPAREDDLNRRLLKNARSENYKLLRRKRGIASNIYYECNNQPAMNDDVRMSRESKRPDFTCGLVDAQAGVDLFLVIECKRLGKPPTPSWVLNENYINNGIRRFVDSSWEYGRGTSSGMMIGYVQSMDAGTALNEVNGNARAARLPELQRLPISSGGKISHFEQDLARGFIETPFKLKHLWVDLQRQYRKERNSAQVA